MRPLHIEGLKTAAKRLRDDTAGAMAVWVAVATPMLIAGSALAVDVSRLQGMDQNLQAGADALAKAGAAELDSRADAIARARAAVNVMIHNDQTFSKDGAGEVAVGDIRFLTALPPRADMVAGSDLETTNPREARFIEVTLATETVRTVLPQGFAKGLVDVDMDAVATAGRSERVCGVAPIFLCNPVEGTSTNLADVLKDKSFTRRQIQFKRATGQTKGGKKQTTSTSASGTWAPGSFGYLDVPGYNGASAMREAVGIDVPDTCLGTGDTVRLETGNINSMHFGFNVRFDMYDGSMSGRRSDPRYAPARNVTRGEDGVGANCRSLRPGAVAMGLPRDACHTTGTCSGLGGTGGANASQIGNGDWDFAAYMGINHTRTRRATIGGVTYTLDADRGTVSPSTPPSRHAVYRWEIDSGNIPGTVPGNLTDEVGAPQCHTGADSPAALRGEVDRRVLRAAVLNCGWLESTGGMNNRDLPVAAFVDVFLTEPVGSGSESAIYGEIVGPSVRGITPLASERVGLAR